MASLESGADDYLVKAFEPAELVTRVGAVLRRSKAGLAESTDGAPNAGWPPPSGDHLDTATW